MDEAFLIILLGLLAAILLTSTVVLALYTWRRVSGQKLAEVHGAQDLQVAVDPLPPTRAARQYKPPRVGPTPAPPPPSSPPTAAVIFLHGLGDTPEGEYAKEFRRHVAPNPGSGHIKWLAPAAPRQPVTGHGGQVLPSWFDILEFPIRVEGRRSRSQDVMVAVKGVHALIESCEAEGIDSRRVLLVGLSQGGATALVSALTYPKPLAGLAVLWGWNPLRDESLEREIHAQARSLKMIWSHGMADPLVKYNNAVAGVRLLERLGVACELLSYPEEAHHPHKEELAMLSMWARERIPPIEPKYWASQRLREEQREGFQKRETDGWESSSSDEDSKKPTAAIIWLHSIGEKAWGGVSSNFNLHIMNLGGGMEHVKWVAPSAPVQAVTCDSAVEMPSWFDFWEVPVKVTSPKSRTEDVFRAVRIIHSLIDKCEEKGISSRRVVLVGVGQGGAAALVSAVTCEKPLGGAAVLWGWNPLERRELMEAAKGRAKGLEVLWSHGMADAVVEYENAGEGCLTLKEMGANVELIGYEHETHRPHRAEMEVLRLWLKRQLPEVEQETTRENVRREGPESDVSFQAWLKACGGKSEAVCFPPIR